MTQPKPLDTRVEEELSDASRNRKVAHQASRARHFIRGPIPMAWLERAAKLPGKAISVALLLWFRDGMSVGEPIKLTPALLKRFEIGRKAGYRAIAALEVAGLVIVERHRGRCPKITLTRFLNR